MIDVWVDGLTPCLRDTVTGSLAETEVIRPVRRSFLSHFNKNTGWYVDWQKFVVDCEVYALVLKGTVDIQGLIALATDNTAKYVRMEWVCVSPLNNVNFIAEPRYTGVGGHLFAIACERSYRAGFDGVVAGVAANRSLLNHYINTFGAVHLGIMHPYHFAILEKAADSLRGGYNFEWYDEYI